MRAAVLMLNMGGPGSLDEVRPFLRNIFSDKDFFKFPGGALGQRFFSWLISRQAAAKARSRYHQIGGGSPLAQWTRDQGEGMRKLLEDKYEVRILPLPCMRYWKPDTAEALARAREWKADDLIAFSQYPHMSTTTTGSSMRELNRLAADVPLPLTAITSWHDHPAYIEAVAECVREGVARLQDQSQSLILYSAHSLPLSIIEQGDPYPDQVRETVALVQEALALPLPHELVWQSKIGRRKWLGPATIDRLHTLARDGYRRVVVVPISFTCDHVETLYELDIQLAAVARSSGIQEYIRAPSLNARPSFVRALADILATHLDELGVKKRLAAP